MEAAVHYVPHIYTVCQHEKALTIKYMFLSAIVKITEKNQLLLTHKKLRDCLIKKKKI